MKHIKWGFIGCGQAAEGVISSLSMIDATEVVADEVSFVASANQNGGASTGAPAGSYTPDAYGAPSFNSTGSANFEELPSDGDLPF